MQQLNQISAGACCLSVLMAKSRFISFWSLAMKSNVSVFSFSHWGFTQSTNKRAKKVAWFYSTNLLNLYTVHTVCLILYNKIWSTTPFSTLQCPTDSVRNPVILSGIWYFRRNGTGIAWFLWNGTEVQVKQDGTPIKHHSGHVKSNGVNHTTDKFEATYK